MRKKEKEERQHFPSVASHSNSNIVLPVGTKRATLTVPSMSHTPQLTLLIPRQSKTSSPANDTGSCLAARSLWHRQKKEKREGVNEAVSG